MKLLRATVLVAFLVDRTRSSVLRGLNDPDDSSEGDYSSLGSLLPAVYLENDGSSHKVRVDEEEPMMAEDLLEYALPVDFDFSAYNVTFADEDEEQDHRLLGRRFSVTSLERNNGAYLQYERKIRNLRTVKWSADLQSEAQKWARRLASIGQLVHRSPLSSEIAPGWIILCENLAMNPSVGWNGAHRALMNSAGHRMNMLDRDVNRVGMGIVKRSRSNQYIVVQIFKAV